MLSPVPPLSPAVVEVVAAYSAPVVSVLRDVRAIIFHVTAMLLQTSGVEEVRPWGQPAYLGYQPEVGSMIYLNRGREAMKEGRQG